MEGAPTQLIGRDGSPVRMSMRDVSPRRSYVQKKQVVQTVVPEQYDPQYVTA